MQSIKKINSFQYIRGVSGKFSDDSRELIITGSTEAISRAKKYLTCENASVSFRISQIKKTLAKGCRYTDKLESELIELQNKEIVEYFAELEDGSLSCPPGLWWLCEHINGHKGCIPYNPLPELNGRQSREYQVEAVKELLKYKRTMISLATGLGKTMITVQLVHCALSVGKRILIIVPNIELVQQTSTALKEYFGNKVCAIGGMNKWKPGYWVYVSTINSAQKVIDVVNVVITDEVHHASSGSYTQTLLMASNAEYVYGLTATPCRADGLVLGVHAACGPVMYEQTARWGIDNGFLAPVNINMVYITGLGITSSDNVLAAIAYSKMCKHRKTIETLYKLILRAQEKNLKTLILFKTEKVGQSLVNFLKINGINTEVAHAKYRKPLVDFKKGDSNLLVSNSSLLGEGVDIPKIDCLIEICQHASEASIRQVIGRGLRPSQGKKQLLFFSVVLLGYGKYKETAWNDVYGNYSQYRKKIYKELCDNIKEITV